MSWERLGNVKRMPRHPTINTNYLPGSDLASVNAQSQPPYIPAHSPRAARTEFVTTFRALAKQTHLTQPAELSVNVAT
jgi:hypothetical protein